MKRNWKDSEAYTKVNSNFWEIGLRFTKLFLEIFFRGDGNI